MWYLYYTKHALKDKENLIAANLGEKGRALIELLKKDPFALPPRFEKLVGSLSGAYSRRINIQYRLVYMVIPNTDQKPAPDGKQYEGFVKILRMYEHYWFGIEIAENWSESAKARKVGQLVKINVKDEK